MNRLTTHFSECMPVIKQCMIVLKIICSFLVSMIHTFLISPLPHDQQHPLPFSDFKLLLFFRCIFNSLLFIFSILYFLHDFIYGRGYNLCWRLWSKYAQKVVHYLGLELKRDLGWRCLYQCLVYILNLTICITELFKDLAYFSVTMLGLSFFLLIWEYSFYIRGQADIQ